MDSPVDELVELDSNWIKLNLHTNYTRNELQCNMLCLSNGIAGSGGSESPLAALVLVHSRTTLVVVRCTWMPIGLSTWPSPLLWCSSPLCQCTSSWCFPVATRNGLLVRCHWQCCHYCRCIVHWALCAPYELCWPLFYCLCLCLPLLAASLWSAFLRMGLIKWRQARAAVSNWIGTEFEWVTGWWGIAIVHWIGHWHGKASSTAANDQVLFCWLVYEPGTSLRL